MLGEGKTIVEVVQGLGGVGADVSPLAQAVRRDEGRRRQAPAGARARERAAEADRRRSGAGDAGAEGGREGKLVSPARRRQAVAMLRDRLGVSERWACRSSASTAPRNATSPTPVDADGGAAGAVARVLRRSGRGGATGARMTTSVELGQGGQPQARAAPVARGRPARPGAAAQAPRSASRPSREIDCGRAARSGVGDRLPVRPDRRRARAEAAQRRRRVHPRGAGHARRAPHRRRPDRRRARRGSSPAAARPRTCAATTGPS